MKIFTPTQLTDAAVMDALDQLSVDPDRLPRHVACVMDGNGRWAQQRGMHRTAGHAAGEAAFLDVVEGAFDLGIEWLTLYAFSTENWNRPADEVHFLMEFNRMLLERHSDELNRLGVRIRIMGRRDANVPDALATAMDEAIELTRSNTTMTLTIAFNYGGQAELVDAFRQMLADGVEPEEVDCGFVRRYLYDPDMPDVDLMIRPSGEVRISNFMLWQVAYSELVFVDVLWPDFRRQHLFAAVSEHQRRDRRFGGVVDLRGAEELSVTCADALDSILCQGASA